MKLAILCQEEPVFLGPFLQGVIRLHPERIAAVFLAGRRSAGEPVRTAGQRLESLRALWLIMEPRGFLGSLGLRLRSRLLGARDPRSVEGLARGLGLPVHAVGDPNGPEFHELLRRVAPDAVLNQSERLLRREVLSIPRLGFVNRHASLLPACRGRMAGFRSHAAEPPRYGLTIHAVDEGVDTGPIILQREFADVDPAWPYPRVMRHLLAGAPELFWSAMERLESPGFVPAAQIPVDEPFRFPTLSEARNYRRVLAGRRGAR
ncbi:MAG TPA: formyltransferase family protein [Planctomycetota bacterium]|nr:formyltransferase family protein [Planctomycetota bacterium]